MISALDLQFECPGGAVVVVQALVGPLLRRDGLGGAADEALVDLSAVVVASVALGTWFQGRERGYCNLSRT